MLLITHEIAQRLETAEALDAAGCTEGACKVKLGCEPSLKSIGGGVLTYCGSTSPLTHAIGLGMHGPVTEEEIAEVEEFFVSRNAPVSIDLTPFADPSLHELLSERGYYISEFNQVMVRELAPGQAQPEFVSEARIRKAGTDEKDLYVRTAIGGFFGRPQLTDEERIIGEIIFEMPYATQYLAEVDGEAVGSSGMSIRNAVASCFGDSTVPAFRKRGVQTALICARIGDAASAGCDLMTAATHPGSSSQLNYQRLGFQIAYSKITMVLG